MDIRRARRQEIINKIIQTINALKGKPYIRNIFINEIMAENGCSFKTAKEYLISAEYLHEKANL